VEYPSVFGMWSASHAMGLITAEIRRPVSKAAKPTTVRSGHVISPIPISTTRLRVTQLCTVSESTTSVATLTPVTQGYHGVTPLVSW